MINDLLTLVLALAVLVKASGYLVKSATKVAKAVGVSEFIIGITLVAFGTSVPELANAVAAAVYQKSGLALGNILGSNIILMSLVLGIAAFIAPIMIEGRMFYKEGLFVLAISVIFYAMASNMMISRFEGIILLSAFGAYILYLVETEVFRGAISEFLLEIVKAKAKNGIAILKDEYAKRKAEEKAGNEPLGRRFLAKHSAIMILSLAALYFSTQYIIPAAHNIAVALKVPDSAIGVTMLAVGTTLPELSVTLAAARQGKSNLLVGNILGSCIANILLIIGISAAITPFAIASGISLYYFFPVLILFVLLLLLFIRTSWIVRMFEGLILVFLYAAFVGVLIYLLKTGAFTTVNP